MSTGSNLVYFYVDTQRIVIRWDDVACYTFGTTSALAGQIILTDAAALGSVAGDMDIEFRYEHASHRGYDATAGWNVGVDSNVGAVEGRDYFVIEISGDPDDVGDLSFIDEVLGNSSQMGLWCWSL